LPNGDAEVLCGFFDRFTGEISLLENIGQDARAVDGRAAEGDARVDNDGAISTARVPTQRAPFVVVELRELSEDRSIPVAASLPGNDTVLG